MSREKQIFEFKRMLRNMQNMTLDQINAKLLPIERTIRSKIRSMTPYQHAKVHKLLMSGIMREMKMNKHTTKLSKQDIQYAHTLTNKILNLFGDLNADGLMKFITTVRDGDAPFWFKKIRVMNTYPWFYNRLAALKDEGYGLDSIPGYNKSGFHPIGAYRGQPPAADYRDNYWIPPYEIPVEPNYFPGYNIESLTPMNSFYDVSRSPQM